MATRQNRVNHSIYIRLNSEQSMFLPRLTAINKHVVKNTKFDAITSICDKIKDQGASQTIYYTVDLYGRIGNSDMNDCLI